MQLGKDDPRAQEWAARLAEGANLPHRYIEKPAMQSCLPDLAGRRVLALGCGSGEEVSMLFTHGAAAVTGIDISEGLIEIARQQNPTADFAVMGMEDLHRFGNASFDFVFASMAVHFLPDWKDLLAQCARILGPGGVMLFSVAHPVKWSAEIIRASEGDRFLLGYERPKEGTQKVHGDYLQSRLITDKWFDGTLDVSFTVRPFEAMFADILESPFSLEKFIEPRPVPQARDEHPDFYATHQKIPLMAIFLIALK